MTDHHAMEFKIMTGAVIVAGTRALLDCGWRTVLQAQVRQHPLWYFAGRSMLAEELSMDPESVGFTRGIKFGCGHMRTYGDKKQLRQAEQAPFFCRIHPTCHLLVVKGFKNREKL